jgi:hypothetical protein
MRSTSVDSFSDDHGSGFVGFDTNKWSGWWWRWLSIRQVYVECATLHQSKIRVGLVIPSMLKVKVEAGGTDAGILCLVGNCPALRSLTIKRYGVHKPGEHLTETAFEAVGFYCKDDLEEFSYLDYRGYDVDDGVLLEHYKETAAAVVDMLRRCSKLKKVSLTGDTLCSMKLEDLLPFGHLFHELQIDVGVEIGIPATSQAVSNLLSRCGNLRKIYYTGDEGDEEKDRLALTALCQSCPLLEEVTLAEVSLVTLDAALAGFCSMRIRKLALIECDLSASSLRTMSGMESLQDLELNNCRGLTDAGIAALAVLKLTKLIIWERGGDNLEAGNEMTEAAFESFAGANISHTLESLQLDIGTDRVIDDERVATALASCRNLKSLQVELGDEKCIFGRNGLDGLQAMVKGCPLLTTVTLCATIPGLYCIATHCSNLKKCRSPQPVGVRDELRENQLRTLYPAIEWKFDFGVVDYGSDDDSVASGSGSENESGDGSDDGDDGDGF